MHAVTNNPSIAFLMALKVRIVEHGVASPSALAYPIVKKTLEALLHHHRNSEKAKIDLCCGNTHGTLAFTLTNDKDPSKNADKNMDALQLLKTLDSNSSDLIFFDPPFSDHQVNKQYDNHGANIGPRYLQDVFVEMERVLVTGGQVVICGFDGATPPGLREDLLLLCNGGGDNPAMIVAISSKGPCAALPDNVMKPCEDRSEPVAVELVESDCQIYLDPQVHASLKSIVDAAETSVSVCDPGDHGLAFTKSNNIRWGTRACPNVDDVKYIKSLEPASQQVVMCKPPTIKEGASLCGKEGKYNMMFGPGDPRPTNAAYPSALKEATSHVLASGGHAILVGECAGVGFKTRGLSRTRVFMQRRGLRKKAHYVSILKKSQ